MKTLLLLRHAKSSWKEPGLSDFERPLNGRGLKAAPLMGRFLRRKNLQPDLILSSPAKRASQTTRLVIEAMKLDAEPEFDEHIYEASVQVLLEIISEIEDGANAVLLVGHNPGLEELLEFLTGEARQMSTAALAYITLNIDKWSEARRRRAGRLEWLVKPKELAER
jgi:phosphohistidine phosphatase